MTEKDALLDTDNRWHDYCFVRNIRSPFQKELRNKQKWHEQIDEYLRLGLIFRLWDYHFWMDWDRFTKASRNSEEAQIYMPCDCADRQCALACTYFGGKCPREKEELKTPAILGFDGRWQFNDDYDC